MTRTPDQSVLIACALIVLFAASCARPYASTSAPNGRTEVGDIFDRWDLNADGYLDKDEFDSGFPIDTYFGLMDFDKNRLVDRSEMFGKPIRQ